MLRKVLVTAVMAGMFGVAAIASNGSGCDMSKSPSNKSCMDGKKDCMGMPKSLATVKLSADQKAKLEAISEEFRIMKAQLHAKNKKPNDPFMNPNGFDEQTFKKEASAMMNQQLDLKAAELAKIWAVLTPEQQNTIKGLSK